MVQPILSLNQARVAFGPKTVFDGIEAIIRPRDRIALVGRNGAGKSTLLAVLAGLIELDGGERSVAGRSRIGYLPQAPSLHGFATAGAYVEGPHGEDGLAIESHVAAAALEEISIDPNRSTTGLSGGEARKIALARALAADPDVLLLDEPTNHLDIETILWLERRLEAGRAAFVAISHDRAFLGKLAKSCWWLERTRLIPLARPFHELDEAIAETLEQEAQATAKLDKLIAQETHWSRHGITARRKRNQGRLRHLDDLRNERASLLRPAGEAKLAVERGEASGRVVIEADAVSKAFGERVIVEDFSLRVLRGDRIALVGPKGAGKTTLIRILTGEIEPDSGTVKRGTKLTIARFEQGRESLDLDATPWSVLCPDGGDTITVGSQSRHVVGYLKDFLFEERQAKLPVKSLSGGERSRLLLARILARPANLLVLDEPTNDLDVETLDLLVDRLSDYDGTLLLVSHDRDFIDRLATATIAFEAGGRLSVYAGGYRDMVAQITSPTEEPAEDEPKKAGPKTYTTPGKEVRRQQRELEKAERKLARLQATIASLEAKLSDMTLFAQDQNAYENAAQDLDRTRSALAEAEDQWLILAEATENRSTG